ncbi:MAG: hypothetical protein V9F05_17145 [Chitinophagaceae bacterium]
MQKTAGEMMGEVLHFNIYSILELSVYHGNLWQQNGDRYFGK